MNTVTGCEKPQFLVPSLRGVVHAHVDSKENGREGAFYYCMNSYIFLTTFSYLQENVISTENLPLKVTRSGIYLNPNVPVNINVPISSHAWATMESNFSSFQNRVKYCPMDFFDVYVQKIIANSSVAIPEIPPMTILLSTDSPSTRIQAWNRESEQNTWAISWESVHGISRSIIMRNGTQYDIFLHDDFQCGLFGSNLLKDSDRKFSDLNFCDNRCESSPLVRLNSKFNSSNNNSSNTGIFSTSPTLYIEFLAIIIVFAVVHFLNARYTNQKTERSQKNEQASIISRTIVCFLSVLFFTFIGAIITNSLESYTFIGNLLTTTLIVLMWIPRFLLQISELLYSYKTISINLRTLAYASWILLPVWGVFVMDTKFIANGAIGKYFGQFPEAALIFNGVIPLSILVSVLMYRGADAFSIGQLMYIDFGLIISFCLINLVKVDLYFRILTVLFSYYCIFVGFYAFPRLYREGSKPLAVLTSTIFWIIALTYNFKFNTWESSLHWGVNLSFVIFTNLFRYMDRLLASFNVLVSISFVTRVLSATPTLLSPIFNIILVSAGGFFAFYLTQIRDARSLYPPNLVQFE